MSLKIAVVGCRGFGKIHLNALSKLRDKYGLEVYVFSRAEEYARDCHREYDTSGYFMRYSDVLRSDVDIIDLVVSHDAHMPMSIAALEAGKHVMLEKPIARTIEEAVGIINVARSSGRKFMVLENHYFDPSVWKAKELMGKLGKISMIIVRKLQFNSPGGWRRIRRLMGGGALIDGGIHYIDTLLNLGGDYTGVKSICTCGFAGLEGEDTSVSIFKFKNGAVGTLLYSWSSPGGDRAPAFEVYGERGFIMEDPDSRVPGKPYGDLVISIDEKREKVIVEKVNVIEREIELFIQSVINNADVPMPPEIALRDLRAVLDAYKDCGELGVSSQPV
ncbi:MAG: Gfo/Idh/MocA family protein [Vulcanisaeta sp.]|uniref:Gfo/Idh/MocA family protein n=1 Tax=Vulcanisaeta sp. TaxID=2020871 RepID=UPI003D0DA119